MKLTPDDPKLSAYVLGELPDEERRAVEHAAATDPAIRLSLNDLEKTCHWLTNTLNPASTQQLHPSQREAVRKASRELTGLDPSPKLSSEQRLRSTIIPAAAAAAIIAAAVVLFNWFVPNQNTRQVAETTSATPTWSAIPGPDSGTASSADANRSAKTTTPPHVASAGQNAAKQPWTEPNQPNVLPDPNALPPTRDQSAFSAATSMRLPVLVGNQSYAWTRRWIREHNQWPPRHAVRVEEFINAANLETTTWTEGLELGVAVADCPWDSDSKLVGIQLVADRNHDQTDLILESQATASRRVIGSFTERNNAALPTVLPAGRSNLIMLEIRGQTNDLGKLVLHHGADVLAIDLSQRAQTNRAEMAHAVALATFGRWLRHEIDADAMQRALSLAESQVTDSLRRDSLKLVREAQSIEPSGE